MVCANTGAARKNSADKMKNGITLETQKYFKLARKVPLKEVIVKITELSLFKFNHDTIQLHHFI